MVAFSKKAGDRNEGFQKTKEMVLGTKILPENQKEVKNQNHPLDIPFSKFPIFPQP